MAREFVTLECTVCGARNYRTQMQSRGDAHLRLKKYCPRDRKHTEHGERKK
ncbi:MAG: 50S ribosomal protein L33 [Planctomycetes bacterium]|nr:50S ribosomal protein L33 [Planctomycetota bacterium]